MVWCLSEILRVKSPGIGELMVCSLRKKNIGQKRSDPSGTEWSPIYCWLSDQRQVGNCLADSDTHRTCRKSQNMGAIGRYNDKDVDNRWQQWFQDTGWVRRHFQYCSMNLHELTQSCWDKEDEGRLVSQCARNFLSQVSQVTPQVLFAPVGHYITLLQGCAVLANLAADEESQERKRQLWWWESWMGIGMRIGV